MRERGVCGDLEACQEGLDSLYFFFSDAVFARVGLQATFGETWNGILSV